jgi:DNA-binding NtrC family response regulator
VLTANLLCNEHRRSVRLLHCSSTSLQLRAGHRESRSHLIERTMTERTVLLVDCDEAQLAGLADMVAAGGYPVVSCRCFEAARQYLQAHTPSAIIADVRLGAFNGLHLVLLAKQTAPDVTAIVYSGREDSGIRQEAAVGGATYLERETLSTSLIVQLCEGLATAARLSAN